MTSARRLALIAGISASALVQTGLAGAQAPAMLGFSPAGAAHEAALEAQFDAV